MCLLQRLDSSRLRQRIDFSLLGFHGFLGSGFHGEAAGCVSGRCGRRWTWACFCCLPQSAVAHAGRSNVVSLLLPNDRLRRSGQWSKQEAFSKSSSFKEWPLTRSLFAVCWSGSSHSYCARLLAMSLPKILQRSLYRLPVLCIIFIWTHYGYSST